MTRMWSMDPGELDEPRAKGQWKELPMIASGADPSRTAPSSPSARHSHAARWRSLSWPVAKHYLLWSTAETAVDRERRGWTWQTDRILDRYNIPFSEWDRFMEQARRGEGSDYPRIPMSYGQALYEVGWLTYKIQETALKTGLPDPLEGLPEGHSLVALEDRDGWPIPKLSQLFSLSMPRCGPDADPADLANDPAFLLAPWERPKKLGMGVLLRVCPFIDRAVYEAAK